MNKELINKYKLEFDYWLNGGKILYKHTNSNAWWNEEPWSYSISYVTAIIIKDEYVELRKALAEGDLDCANKMLGKPFSIDEEVIHGKKRGRLLGFPTANLAIKAERAMVPNGVYVVEAYVEGKKYQAVASVGTNPTFEDISRRVEVNIFDFQQTIYGQIMRVDFLKMLRREIKFTSVDALLNQMKKDVKQAKAYFVKE